MGEPVRHVINNKNYMHQRIILSPDDTESEICECCDDVLEDCACEHDSDEYCV